MATACAGWPTFRGDGGVVTGFVAAAAFVFTKRSPHFSKFVAVAVYAKNAHCRCFAGAPARVRRVPRSLRLPVRTAGMPAAVLAQSGMYLCYVNGGGGHAHFFRDLLTT